MSPVIDQPDRLVRGHAESTELEPRIRWEDARHTLPDDDTTVLVALLCGEVWTGFHDEGRWRYVSADPISEPVTHWSHFPPPPAPCAR